MKIEKATREHLEQILEIEKASFTMPWSKDSFMGELRAKESYFTVAVEDDKVVGFCILRAFEDEAEIFNIAVLPEYRRRYIAEDLLSETMRYARANDVMTIFLEVRKSNIAAQNLYKKAGFREFGIRRGYYDFPTEDAVLMIYEAEV